MAVAFGSIVKYHVKAGVDLPAIVRTVHAEDHVDLSVLDSAGTPGARSDVMYLEDVAPGTDPGTYEELS